MLSEVLTLTDSDRMERQNTNYKAKPSSPTLPTTTRRASTFVYVQLNSLEVTESKYICTQVRAQAQINPAQ